MWYFRQHEQNVGPFDDERMLAVVRAGIVKSHEYVWREGSPAWVPLATTQFAAAANLVALLHPGPPPEIVPTAIETQAPPPFDNALEQERMKNPYATDFGSQRGRGDDAPTGMSHLVIVTIFAIVLIVVATAILLVVFAG